MTDNSDKETAHKIIELNNLNQNKKNNDKAKKLDMFLIGVSTLCAAAGTFIYKDGFLPAVVALEVSIGVLLTKLFERIRFLRKENKKVTGDIKQMVENANNILGITESKKKQRSK